MRLFILFMIYIAKANCSLYPDICSNKQQLLEISTLGLNDELGLYFDVFHSCDNTKTMIKGKATINQHVFFNGTMNEQTITDLGKYVAFNCYPTFNTIYNFIQRIRKNTKKIVRNETNLCINQKNLIYSIEIECSLFFIKLGIVSYNEHFNPETKKYYSFYVLKSNDSFEWVPNPQIYKNKFIEKIWKRLKFLEIYVYNYCLNDTKIFSGLFKNFKSIAFPFTDYIDSYFVPSIRNSENHISRLSKLTCSFIRLLDNNNVYCKYSGRDASRIGSVSIYKFNEENINISWQNINLKSRGAEISLVDDEIVWGMAQINVIGTEQYICMCHNHDVGENVVVFLPRQPLLQYEVEFDWTNFINKFVYVCFIIGISFITCLWIGFLKILFDIIYQLLMKRNRKKMVLSIKA